MKRKVSLTTAVISCLLTAVFVLLMTCFFITGSVNLLKLPDKGSDFQKLEEINDYARVNYIKPIDDTSVLDQMAIGYLMGLNDPYAAYYTSDEFARLTEENEGQLVGIGISVCPSSDGAIEILTVYPDSPAAEAGFQSGDEIVKVDGQYASEIGFNQATDLLHGEVGTTVTLTVCRNNEEFETSVIRENVEIPSVFYQMDGNIGYIKITAFHQSTVSQFQEALTDLINQGANSLVFDLRDNGGGTLDSVCSILDTLLPEGVLVRQTRADGNTEVLASSGAEEIDLPMAVLTNGNTASAAELFTCDIKDYEKGIQVGEKTYGKGVLQTTHLLQDGSAIKLTTAYYNPAKSDNYDGVGLIPDYEVGLSESQLEAYRNGNLPLSEDPQYQEAIAKLSK